MQNFGILDPKLCTLTPNTQQTDRQTRSNFVCPPPLYEEWALIQILTNVCRSNTKKSGLRGTVWALELCHWKKAVFLFFASPWAPQKGPKIFESQIFILLNLIWVESEQLAKFGVSKSKTVVADGEHMKRQTEKHDFWLFAPQKGPKNFWISNFYPLKPVLCRK